MTKINFQDRFKYLNGSEIATIVKHYFNYDFKVFTDINLMFSYKKWTREQQIQFDEAKANSLNYIFSLGKQWETQALGILELQFGAENIIEYVKSDISFLNEELLLSSTPDFIISDQKILVETKLGNEKSANLRQYLYQVSAQLLCLEQEITEVCIFFKTDYMRCKNDEQYKPYEFDMKVIEDCKKEIVQACKRFWVDFNAENFKFISCEEAMKIYKKEIYQEEDKNILSLLDRIVQHELDSKYINDLKTEIFEQYAKAEHKNISAFCEHGEVKITLVPSKMIVKDEVYFTNEIENAVLKSQKTIKKLEGLRENPSDEEVLLRQGYLRITS